MYCTTPSRKDNHNAAAPPPTTTTTTTPATALTAPSLPTAPRSRYARPLAACLLMTRHFFVMLRVPPSCMHAIALLILSTGLWWCLSPRPPPTTTMRLYIY